MERPDSPISAASSMLSKWWLSPLTKCPLLVPLAKVLSSDSVVSISVSESWSSPPFIDRLARFRCRKFCVVSEDVPFGDWLGFKITWLELASRIGLAQGLRMLFTCKLVVGREFRHVVDGFGSPSVPLTISMNCRHLSMNNRLLSWSRRPGYNSCVASIAFPIFPDKTSFCISEQHNILS